MVKHYVEFLFPGVLFAETTTRCLPSRRSPIRNVPEGCYGWRRFFIETRKSKSGRMLSSDRLSTSATTFIGEYVAAADVPRRFRGPRYAILRSNVRGNREYYRAVCRCPGGNIVPVHGRDRVIGVQDVPFRKAAEVKEDLA